MLAGKDTQEQLIQRCLNNDRIAQKEIYKSLFGKMRAVCRRYVIHPDEVDEVLNSSFMTVFKNLDKYSQIENFDGWVKRIVINRSIDHLRSKKKFQEQSMAEVPQWSQPSYNQGDQDLRMQELFGLIDQLPPMAKTVFNLYAIDGFSHKEIAEKLAISAATSRWHLSSARQQLQASLKKSDVIHAGAV